MSQEHTSSPPDGPARVLMGWPRLWAGAAILLGLGILASRLAAMAQATGPQTAGQFSSALAFALGGAALLAATYAGASGTRPHVKRLALAFAAMLLGLAALRLLRLVTSPGEAADQWLTNHFAIAAVLRTPLNAVASSGLLLWAGSFMLFFARGPAERGTERWHAAALMATSHLVLAAGALVASAAQVWGLGDSSPYPPGFQVAAISHAVLALGLMSLERALTAGSPSGPSPFGWSKFAVALQLTLTVFGWVALNQAEQEHLAQKIGVQSRWLQRSFVEAMSNRTSALDRMARRWEVSGGIAPDFWRDDAEMYVQTLPGFQAIAYADSSGRVARIAPVSGNAKALGFDLRSEAQRRRALDRSRASGAAVFTAQITLAQGGQGFLLAHPLQVAGQFDGWLCAVFRTEDIFALLSKPVDDYSFALEVVSVGRSVYRNNVYASPAGARFSHSFEIPNGDGAWTIRLSPSQAAMEALRSWTDSVLLASGMVMTLLMALAFRLFERSASQKAQLLMAQQSLNALGDEARKLALVSMHTRNAVAITDKAGHCQWVNQAFCEFTGHTAARAVGSHLCALLDSPQNDAVGVAQVRAALASGSRLNVDMPRHRDNLTPMWAAVEVAPVHDDAGHLSQFIIIGTDITNSKQVQHELDASRRFLKNLIDLIPGMVGYWNSDLHCRFANTAYLEWFGRTAAQMQGITMQELLGENLFAKNAPYIHGALQGEPQHFERTITKADGSTGYTWAHYLPDVHLGEVRGFFVLVSDITDIKQAQLRLEEVNLELKDRTREAETANRAKSEFLSRMSHELRTPMNAMLGFAQLIDMDTDLPATHKDNVGEVLRAGKHLLSLINDLLSLTKIEAGHTALKPGTIEASELVNECLALVRPMAADIGIQLEHEAAAPMAFVSDRRLLKQILINLLSNAIKYNRPGGVVRLTVMRTAGDKVCLAVSDTGLGIARDRQSELFQSFNRLGAETSEIDGHGIGLAVCQRLVAVLGGSMAVRSEEGAGSTFSVTLPDILPGAVDSEQVVAEPAPPPLLKTHSTILNIDDSPANRRLVQGILAEHPQLRLLEADTGEAGVEMAKLHRPDLVLMDILLPGMDGVAALEQLRKMPETRHIPVIAISASVMQDSAGRIGTAGFDAQLDKPFVVSEFLALIDRFLTRSQ